MEPEPEAKLVAAGFASSETATKQPIIDQEPLRQSLVSANHNSPPAAY